MSNGNAHHANGFRSQTTRTRTADGGVESRPRSIRALVCGLYQFASRKARGLAVGRAQHQVLLAAVCNAPPMAKPVRDESRAAAFSCAESVTLAWPALKHRLDQLYVAMSLGERTSILARLQQIVPQFSYAEGDEVGGTEKTILKPGAGEILSEAHLEAPTLADTGQSPYRTWAVNLQLNPRLNSEAGPSFEPTGGLGD